METIETKHQTDFYSAKNTNIQQNFNKGFLKISIKYQENTKKFGTEIPIPIWCWYFLGIPNFLFEIDITGTNGSETCRNISPGAISEAFGGQDRYQWLILNT